MDFHSPILSTLLIILLLQLLTSSSATMNFPCFLIVQQSLYLNPLYWLLGRPGALAK